MLSMTPSRRLARPGLALLVALMVLATAAPARSASEEEVAEARRQQEEAAAARAGALTDLNEAAAAYDDLNTQYQDLVYRIGQMRDRIDAYQAEVRDLRESIRQRAVEAYVQGSQDGSLGNFYVSDRAQEALVARQVLARAVEEQAATLDTMESITAEMTQLEADLETKTEEASAVRVEAEAVAARMYELLAEREAELTAANENLTEAEVALAEQRRQEELARQARAAEEERQAAIRAALLGPAGRRPRVGDPRLHVPGAARVDGVPRFLGGPSGWGHPAAPRHRLDGPAGNAAGGGGRRDHQAGLQRAPGATPCGSMPTTGSPISTPTSTPSPPGSGRASGWPRARWSATWETPGTPPPGPITSTSASTPTAWAR